MKMYAQNVDGDETRMEIIFENELSIEFFTNEESNNSWYGSIIFTTDSFDCNNLQEIEELIDSLNLIKTLKEFDEKILICFDGDRGGEFFEITIPYEIMKKIQEAG